MSSRQQPAWNDPVYSLDYRIKMQNYYDNQEKFAERLAMTNIKEKLDKQQLMAAVVGEITPAIINALMTATQTCLTCDHFNEAKELCKMYQARPPARIIAFGCPSYENEIPF